MKRFLLTCTLSLLVGACAPEPAKVEVPSAAGPQSVTSALADLVPKGGAPEDGLVTAGQPSLEDFQRLKEAGLKSVINLRRPDERGTASEPEWMDELELNYLALPIAGAGDLTESAARELDQALANADRPVLLHCGSSNRVGALLALRAHYVQGQTIEEALAFGRAGGLTKLEGTTREILERGAG